MQKRHETREERGYLTLMSVFIIGLTGTAIAISLLSYAANFSRSTIVSEQSFEAMSLADACAESAIMQIKNDGLYAGSEQLTFNEGICQYSVTNDSNVQSSVFSTSTVDVVLRKVKVVVSKTIVGATTTVTSLDWREKADF